MKKIIQKIMLCSLFVSVGMQGHWQDSLQSAWSGFIGGCDSAMTVAVDKISSTVSSLSNKQIGIGAGCVLAAYAGYKFYKNWSAQKDIKNRQHGLALDQGSSVVEPSVAFDWTNVEQVYYNDQATQMTVIYNDSKAQFFNIDGDSCQEVGNQLSNVQCVKWHNGGEFVFVLYGDNKGQIFTTVDCTPISSLMYGISDVVWHPIKPIFFAQNIDQDYCLLNAVGQLVRKTVFSEVLWSPDGKYLYCKAKNSTESHVVDIAGNDTGPYVILKTFKNIIDFQWVTKKMEDSVELKGFSVIVNEWKDPNSWNPLNRQTTDRLTFYDIEHRRCVAMCDDVVSVSWNGLGQACLVQDTDNRVFYALIDEDGLLINQFFDSVQSFNVCAYVNHDRDGSLVQGLFGGGVIFWYKDTRGRCYFGGHANRVQLPDGVTSVSWSPNGKAAFVVVNDIHGFLYDEDGNEIASFIGSKDSCKWTKDGNKFSLNSPAHTGLYDTGTGEKLI